MKVVSVMTTSSQGGGEFAAVDLLDGLAARGHEAVLLSDQPTIGRDTAVVVRALDLGPKLSRSSWRSLLLRWPRLVRDLRAALEREAPYDVLLLHYKKEQLLALALPRRLRRTLAWAEWGPVPYPLRSGLPGRAYAAAGARVQAVLAVSEGTRDSLVEAGIAPERVHVVPNVMRTGGEGFSPQARADLRARIGAGEDDLVVGCVSRFHPKKPNDVVVDAVIALDDPGVHLVLAGDGETEAALRARAAPLGDRAHFLPTPGARVAGVLSAFDVAVFCPSPTEGAPRAVTLAMIAGRPVVATGAEGVAGLVTPETGAVVSPEHDAAALAALLHRYRADPELGRRQGAAAAARAAVEFDPDRVSARIEALLRP